MIGYDMNYHNKLTKYWQYCDFPETSTFLQASTCKNTLRPIILPSAPLAPAYMCTLLSKHSFQSIL